MHKQSFWQLGLMIASMILVMPKSGAQTRQGEVKSWLDKPLSGWNIPGREIPKAPRSDGDPAAQCAGARLADSPEDRAITAKGWMLLGPQQRFGQTLLVSANANVDGQCRPLDYQDFVFVRGLFVGTVSPLPMNSRADGEVDGVHLTSEVDTRSRIPTLHGFRSALLSVANQSRNVSNREKEAANGY